MRNLAAFVRREIDERERTSRNTVQLDYLLNELKSLATEVHGITAMQAVLAVVTRHGPGPWTAEDIAAIAGISRTDAKTGLDEMVSQEWATRYGKF